MVDIARKFSWHPKRRENFEAIEHLISSMGKRVRMRDFFSSFNGSIIWGFTPNLSRLIQTYVIHEYIQLLIQFYPAPYPCSPATLFQFSFIYLLAAIMLFFGQFWLAKLFEEPHLRDFNFLLITY